MVQEPRLAIIPSLNEKRLHDLFLRLAMAMATVIQGDEGGEHRTENEHENPNNTQA